MNPLIALYIALIWISGIVASLLAVAWHAFERPRHAFTWAIAFALATAIFIFDLTARLGWVAALPPVILVPALEGIAVAVNAIGFRQRAGIRRRQGLLLAAAFGYAALVAIMVLAGVPSVVRLIPLALLNAAMLLVAARALTGRRKGERAAERFAQAGLLFLMLVSVGVLGCAVTLALRLIQLDLAILSALALLFLPAIMSGIGLFTIILLTADLADQTRRLAATDMLTGSLNRRGFEDAAHALLESLRRSNRSIALVLIDVDRFKEWNDRFGHPAGDDVLRQVCACLRAEIGRRDILARIGGEEFALVLTNVDLTAAACAAEVLRQKVAELAIDLPDAVGITASFGVSAPQPGERDLSPLFLRADRALYRSKAEGRNRVTVDA